MPQGGLSRDGKRDEAPKVMSNENAEIAASPLAPTKVEGLQNACHTVISRNGPRGASPQMPNRWGTDILRSLPPTHKACRLQVRLNIESWRRHSHGRCGVLSLVEVRTRWKIALHSSRSHWLHAEAMISLACSNAGDGKFRSQHTLLLHMS